MIGMIVDNVFIVDVLCHRFRRVSVLMSDTYIYRELQATEDLAAECFRLQMEYDKCVIMERHLHGCMNEIKGTTGRLSLM